MSCIINWKLNSHCALLLVIHANAFPDHLGCSIFDIVQLRWVAKVTVQHFSRQVSMTDIIVYPLQLTQCPSVYPENHKTHGVPQTRGRHWLRGSRSQEGGVTTHYFHQKSINPRPCWSRSSRHLQTTMWTNFVWTHPPPALSAAHETRIFEVFPQQLILHQHPGALRFNVHYLFIQPMATLCMKVNRITRRMESD